MKSDMRPGRKTWRAFEVFCLMAFFGFMGMAVVLVHDAVGIVPIKKPIAWSELILVLAGGEGRVAAGAKLFIAEGSSRIALTNDGVISRWSKKHGRNLSNIEWSEEELLAAGIPADAIVKLPFSESGTVYDALQARDFVLAQGIKSFTIVTSDYHARRALWIFEKVFSGDAVQIGLYPVREEYPATGSQAGYLRRVMTVGKEDLKYLYYRVRFGLWSPNTGV